VQIYVDDSAVTLFSDDIAPGDLYQRLWNCVIQRHKPILNDTVLQKYCKEHLSSYDKERFLVTGITKKRVPGHSVRAGGMLAILVATVFAIIAGATTDNSEIAIVYAVIGTVIFFAALLLAGIGAIRRNKDQTFSGGIVISPAGLALRNKTLKGEMKWRELLKVELAPSKEKPVGLRLKLAGVTILLLEEYQVPLWYLYRQINFAMLNPEIESTTGSMFVDTQATAKSADISNPYMPPPR
jgi:hypothetical protein